MRPLLVTLTLAALLAPARHAAAQDARWAAWLGCWDLVAENVRDDVGRRPGDAGRRPAASTPRGAAPQVCVERNGPNGVTLTTTVPGQTPTTQTIVADGQPHPLIENDCKGTESTEWSGDGQRLYARAEVACADGAPRAISGLAFITPDNVWLDIRSLRLAGQPTTRVTRYRRVQAGPQRLAGGSVLTLAAIQEASRKVSSSVIEAAIAETKPYVPVNRRTLVQLADAGVSPDVIDVIVALAYPDHFVIERADAYAGGPGPGPVGFPGFGGFYDYYYSGYYFPSFYYSPFGYAYIGSYDPYVFVGQRPPGPPEAGENLPSGTAKVVAGQGYTRIRPNDGSTSQPSAVRRTVPRSDAALATGAGGESTATTSSSGSSSSGSSSAPSSGGSSGGSVSPGGFSSGGGDGGGRTAQPR